MTTIVYHAGIIAADTGITQGKVRIPNFLGRKIASTIYTPYANGERLPVGPDERIFVLRGAAGDYGEAMRWLNRPNFHSDPAMLTETETMEVWLSPCEPPRIKLQDPKSDAYTYEQRCDSENLFFALGTGAAFARMAHSVDPFLSPAAIIEQVKQHDPFTFGSVRSIKAELEWPKIPLIY